MIDYSPFSAVVFTTFILFSLFKIKIGCNVKRKIVSQIYLLNPFSKYHLISLLVNQLCNNNKPIKDLPIPLENCQWKKNLLNGPGIQLMA